MYEFSSQAAIDFYYFDKSKDFIEELQYQGIVDPQEYSLPRLASFNSKQLVIEDIVVHIPISKNLEVKDYIEGKSSKRLFSATCLT